MIPYFTTLTIILVYLISLYFLKTIGALSEIGFFSNITISIGWIVALFIAFFHLSENRKDNQRLKKEEIKRSLEIDAFREINKAVTNFANVLSEASREYKWRPFRLERDLAWDKEHLQDTEFRFHNAKTAIEVDNERQGLMRRLDEFKLTIEAHEIAVIQFDHEIKRIKSETDRLDRLIIDLRHFLMMNKKDNFFMDKVFSDFKKNASK